MRECAMNGEFDNTLYSDMQDLTKKIKEINQNLKDTTTEKDNNVSELNELSELNEKLQVVKETIINKNKQCSLEATSPNLADYIKMNLNLCSHLIGNLMKEEYNFKGVNFNELEDVDAIASFNRFQNKESEAIKQKEKEEKAKEKKLKQEQEREMREQKEKEIKEQKEKERLEKEKEKELKRKRNIVEEPASKTKNNAKSMSSGNISDALRKKKDMNDDDVVNVTSKDFAD